MKYLLLCSLFMCVFTYGKSQDSSTTLSVFEKFITKPGNVIKTEIMIIGQYGPYKVLKYIATDIVTQERLYAVRIDNHYFFEVAAELTNREALYIDSAELDTFITTAEGFLKTSDGVQLSIDTRFTYLTPADVRLSCYFATYSNSWSFSIDKVFQKLRTEIPGTDVPLNKKRMQQLISLLKQVREK